MFLFTRRHTFYFSLPKEELKRRLVGEHVRIHNLDFEVLETERKLSIIPHAEQVETIKTLPITSVVFKEDGNRTKVVVTSKMRQLDSGGPFLILLFSSFMIITGLVLLKMNVEQAVAFTLLGISAFILTLFTIRLQTGYFDYVHKVRHYVKSKGEPAFNDHGLPLLHA
jgi:hypothetical protein